MKVLRRGSLRSVSESPAEGEISEELARLGPVVIEQIVSGALPAPITYDQDHDEWVVVLSGAAELELGDVRMSLESGDWVLLPAHIRHTLLETRPGTSWLAVHAGTSPAP